MIKAFVRNLAWISVLAFGLGLASAAGSPGSADTSYGTGGAAYGGKFFVEDAAVLSDGSVLVVGIDQSSSTSTYAVQKFDADGALDTSFGTNGVAAVFGAPPASQNWAGTVAVGPDGRIFVGGRRTYTTQVTSGKGKHKTTSNQDVTTGCLLALNADGSVDTDFAADGYLDMGWSVPTGLAMRGTSSSFEVVIATAVQETTEIAGSGHGKKNKTQTINTAALALRVVDGFTGDDVTSFGDNGIAVDDVDVLTDEIPETVEIDGLGRIVVLSGQYPVASGTTRDVLVTRYSSSGVLDTTLGTSGRLSVGSLGFPIGMSLAIDGDGKRILVSARTPATSSTYKPVVVRYAGTGSTIDTTFDVPELADSGDASAFDTWPVDLDVNANGKVCVTLWYGVDNYDFTVVRCNADGTRDTSFGPSADGIAEILDLTDTEEPKACVVDSSGRLIVVGQSSYPIQDVQPYYEAFLARFNG